MHDRKENHEIKWLHDFQRARSAQKSFPGFYMALDNSFMVLLDDLSERGNTRRLDLASASDTGAKQDKN